MALVSDHFLGARATLALGLKASSRSFPVRKRVNIRPWLGKTKRTQRDQIGWRLAVLVIFDKMRACIRKRDQKEAPSNQPHNIMQVILSHTTSEHLPSCPKLSTSDTSRVSVNCLVEIFGGRCHAVTVWSFPARLSLGPWQHLLGIAMPRMHPYAPYAPNSEIESP